MKIALISDIHYGCLAATKEFAIEGEPLELGDVENAKPLLQGAIDIIAKEKPEYLFVAGDLTSTGSPIEFEYCYNLLLQLSSEIGVDSHKIIFCIGNHDIDWRTTKVVDTYHNIIKSSDIALIRAQYQKMASTIAHDILNNGNHSQLCANYTIQWEKPFAGILEYDNCIVFVFNTSYSSSHLQNPKHGCIGSDQLNWFEENARKYKSTKKPKFALLHHHPRIYPNLIPSIDVSTLEEGGEFTNICGNNGISLVLHGHKHQPRAITQFETGWQNPVTFICAGSLSVNFSHRWQQIPNTLHIIDYISENFIELSNYSYSPIDGWKFSVDTDQTPVDGKMLLGQTIDISLVREKVRDLPTNSPILYSSLDISLKYMPKKQLKGIIQEEHNLSEFFDADDKFIIFNNEEDT